MTTDFDSLIKEKENSLPRIKQILEKLLGSNDFQVGFETNIKSELWVEPGNTLPSTLKRFHIYYHRSTSSLDRINVKAGKGITYKSEDGRFMFDRLISGEISYLLVDYGGKFFHVIELGETFTKILVSSDTLSGTDGSFYSSVWVNTLNFHNLILQSNVPQYKRPTFIDSYDNPRIKKFIQTCFMQMIKPKTSDHIGSSHSEIEYYIKNRFSREYFVPLKYSHQHYIMRKDISLAQMDRIEEVIWRAIKDGVKQKMLLRIKLTKGYALYFWNPKFNFIAGSGKMSEFEQEE